MNCASHLRKLLASSLLGGLLLAGCGSDNLAANSGPSSITTAPSQVSHRLANSTALPGPSVSPSSLPGDLQHKYGVLWQGDNLLDNALKLTLTSPSGFKVTYEFFDQTELDNQWDCMRDAGVKLVRAGILWQQIQPVDPEAHPEYADSSHWNWQPVDQVLEAASRRQMKVIWILGDTAPWNAAPGHTDEDATTWVPADLVLAPSGYNNKSSHWARFVGALVQHMMDKGYLGVIDSFEVRNEVNTYEPWWGITPDPTVANVTQANGTQATVTPANTSGQAFPAAVPTFPDAYAYLLTQAAQAVNATAGSAAPRIVFSGLGGDLVSQSQYWHQHEVQFLNHTVYALRQDVRDEKGSLIYPSPQALPFQVLNFHAYPADTTCTMDNYLTYANQTLGYLALTPDIQGMPLWITEIDYPSYPTTNAQSNWPFQNGESSQADALVYFATQLIDQTAGNNNKIERLFWASLLDDASSGWGFYSTGLCEVPLDSAGNMTHLLGRRKQSYYRMQNLLVHQQ